MQAKQRGKIAKTVKMAKSFEYVILTKILMRLMTDFEATRQIQVNSTDIQVKLVF